MSRRRQSERGAIAVLAGLLVMVLGGFLALTLDLGHKFNARAQLGSAVDAASLSGVSKLDAMSTGLVTASLTAAQTARAHFLDQSNVIIDSTDDVVLGFWDSFGKKFTADGNDLTLGDGTITLNQKLTPQYFNAVKVTAGADGGKHNAPLNVYFGAFVGYSGTLAAATAATAVGGGPCDEDFRVFPVVVKSCSIANAAGSTLCGQQLNLSFRGGADAAFGDLTPPSTTVTESEINTQMTNSGGGGPLEPGADAVTHAVVDKVGITDGLGSGAGRPAPFKTATINTLNGRVGTLFVLPVVNTGRDCGPLVGNGDQQVTPVGFVEVTLDGVTWNAAANSIRVTIVCTGQPPSNFRGGCAYFGLASQFPPSLVK